MQLKIPFYGACLKFLMQSIYLKMFCSQNVIFDLSQPSNTKKVKQRKTLLMQVKTFFYIANKCIYLKLSMQKLHFKIFHSHTVMLDLSQISIISKNEIIWVSLSILKHTKKTNSLIQLKTFYVW